MQKFLFIFSFFILLHGQSHGQQWLVPADTLHPVRSNIAFAVGGVTYLGFSTGLYYAWYKQFDRTGFHFFNDIHEWNQMDKAGHIHSAYFQGVIAYKGMRWAGMNKQKSMLTGIITGTVFQSTLEIMDGFSSKWGFSWSDMAANVVGTSTFALQQHFWDEQRISLKVSSIPVKYPEQIVFSTDQSSSMSLGKRAESLYGSNYFEKFLKDYNAQAYWASFNVHAFLADGNKWPEWLNIALGYGAENMYGGFDNVWYDQGATYILDPVLYPRYRQFYLGFDFNLPGMKPKNPFLKTIFSMLDVFRIPAPAIEINTRGEVVFHLLR